MGVWFNSARDKWMYEFWRKGVRHKNYCMHPATGALPRNKKEAEEFEVLIRAEVIKSENKPAPLPPLSGWTLAEAVDAYSKAVKSKPTWPTISRHLGELLSQFGANMLVADITKAKITSYRDWALEQPVMIWVGGPIKRDEEAKRAGNKPLWKPRTMKDENGNVAPVLRDGSTVNRYLDTFKAVLHVAHEAVDERTKQRMLEVVPTIEWAEDYDTSPQPFGLQTFVKLYNDAPQHVRETMVLSALLGFRLRQALYAKASDADLELNGYRIRRRGSPKARRGRGHKHKRELFIPFGPVGRAYVAALKARAERLGIDRLILYHDHRTGVWRPIDAIATAWGNLLARHGLKGLHTFHNVKTTALSNIASVASLAVTQELGQHADPRTTKKHYVAIENDPKRQAIADLESKLMNAGLDLTPTKVLMPLGTDMNEEEHAVVLRSQLVVAESQGTPDPAAANGLAEEFWINDDRYTQSKRTKESQGEEAVVHDSRRRIDHPRYGEWDRLRDAELTRLIWSKPARDVAAEFGISDVAVANRCNKRGIPKPPRGFWAKVRAGHLPHPKGHPVLNLAI
jgi:hypothetical protein